MDVVREWSKEVIRGGTKGELTSEAAQAYAELSKVLVAISG